MKVIKKEEYIEDLVIQIPLQQAIENNTIDAIPLERIKKVREEMYEAAHADADGWETVIDLEDAFEILDKLIESEDKP